MSQLFVDNIKNRTGGAVGFPTGVVVTGVATFNNQVSIAGTLTYEDVTNVDSTGIITAKSGVKVTGGEILVGSGFSVGQAGIVTASGIRVGTAITIDATSGIITATSFSGPFSASTGSFTDDVDIADKIVHTGDTNTAIRFPAADTFTVETAGSERTRVDSAGRFLIGASTARSNFFNATIGAALQVEGTDNDTSTVSCVINSASTDPILTLARSRGSSVGSNTIVQSGDTLGRLIFQGSDGSEFVQAGSVICESDGTPGANDMPGRLMFSTTADGAVTPTERLRITSGGGFHFTNGELIERAKVTAGKLSDNTNIDLENGMVHLFTTQETTTSTPNIRINSSTSLNSVMAIGEMISVTLITTAAAGAYSAQLTIDGSAVTKNWTGGSAPDAGGSSGVDIHAYTIIKTADATFTVIATQTTTS